jgi:hypothetical protein
MENLHLKNLNDDPKKILPTNQKYLNKVFSTPNLSYEEFNKTFILHINHYKSSTVKNLINDLYELYKTNVKNYQQLTYKLFLYNTSYMNNNPYYGHVDFSNIIIQTYTEDQIIKELYDEDAQKLFYEYIDNLNKIRDKKFPHIQPVNRTDELTKQYHLSTLLISLTDSLTEEEKLTALPKNLPILNTNKDDNKNIIQNITSNKPNFKLQEPQKIERKIRQDYYHLLNMLRKFQLIKYKK